jgi:hypothetical protein
MAVGGSLAVLLVNRTELSWGLFLVGWAIAWTIGEKWFGARLIGVADLKAMILALASGFAFPWFGVAFAALFDMLRP